ncbi:MAG: acyltransferase [Paracoccus sp. (in: a-proteobacteria)]|uniref:acyltransferase family protein n=1 Tax=Paracoccus sp. TaxID=267 RepID=UPI0039E35452
MSGFSRPVHGGRGLFALSVVIYHVFNSGLPPVPMPWLLHQGFDSLKFGVELFFMISGYVIVGTMARARTPVQFIADRATRIYPVLWAVLPVAILANLSVARGPLADGGILGNLGMILANFLALGPVLPVTVIYGVTWTLSFEFAFYLLGFMILLGRRRGLDLTWLALALGLSYCVTEPRALYFLPGVLVALGWVEKVPLLRLLSRAPLFCLLAFLALWQAGSSDAIPHIPPIYQWHHGWIWLTGPLAFLAATTFMNGLVHGRGLMSRLLQTGPFIWLGTISYSLYIWHPLVLGPVKNLFRKLALPEHLGALTQPAFLLITLPVCLLIATLSARYLEAGVTAWLRGRRRPPASVAEGESPAALKLDAARSI